MTTALEQLADIARFRVRSEHVSVAWHRIVTLARASLRTEFWTVQMGGEYHLFVRRRRKHAGRFVTPRPLCGARLGSHRFDSSQGVTCRQCAAELARRLEAADVE